MKWLDVREIKDKDMPFNVLVGARRIGKTYGVLLEHLKDKTKVLFMRRTERELSAAFMGKENPYTEVAKDLGLDIRVKYSSTIGYGTIDLYESEEQVETIGYIAAMSTFFRVRGVTFNSLDELIFDEFIPEEHVVTKRGEDIAFLNMLETAMSNREFLGRKPLKVWLLANAINLNSPISSAIGIIPILESMILSNQQRYTNKERGLFIFYGGVKEVAEAKRQTALYKLLDGVNDDFIETTLGGKFAKTDTESIRKKIEINEYKCVFDIDNKIFVYLHKNIDNPHLHVCRIKADSPTHYTKSNPVAIRKIWTSRLRLYLDCKMLTFSDYQLQVEFTDLIL